MMIRKKKEHRSEALRWWKQNVTSLITAAEHISLLSATIASIPYGFSCNYAQFKNSYRSIHTEAYTCKNTTKSI